MNDEIREWCARAWSTVSSLPANVGDDFRDRWKAHAKNDQVVVTLYGPYDSGKSSLLKRLLVDDQQPVPDWLTVSGRRETFELCEVMALGVLVRDTPGIAGGNEQHELAAQESLLHTDAIVLVLPPQLVTSDRDAIMGVLTGTRFMCPANVAHPPRSLVVVLSRMDEAGVMPRDDAAGYGELLARKCREFEELLRSEGVAKDLVAIYPVAADPFGLVGNGIPSGPEVYDADRRWDGVAALAEAVRGLVDRKTELRLRAEARFLGAVLGEVTSLLERMGDETRTSAEAVSNEARAHALVQDRITAMLLAARAELDRRIEEEVSASARRGAADVNELRDAVLVRLEGTLDRWSKEQDAVLQSLLREADAEMNVRRERPAWRKLSDVLSGTDEEPEPDGKGPQETIDKIRRLSKMLHKGFREAQPAALGMTVEKARNELQMLRRAGSFEEYAKQASRKASRLRDVSHAAQARRTVLLDAGFDVALPALLELSGLIAEVYVDRKLAEERANRREKVRRVVTDASTKLADRAWSLWREEGMPAGIANALAAARLNAEVTANTLGDEARSISASLDIVRACLHDLERMGKQ